MATKIEVKPGATCTKDDTGVKTWTRKFNLYDDSGSVINTATAYASAYNYVKSNKTFDGLHAKSISFEELSEGAQRVHTFSVTYTVNGDLGEEDDTTNIRGTLRFSTKGGSSHINHSLGTTAYQSRDVDSAPDYQGLINVVNGQAQGVDIQTPALHLDVTAKIPTALVTPAWLSNFYNLTACVNSTALWGFPAGTLIFRGLDGGTDGQGTCNLTFSFDYHPNFTGNIDPFDSVTKGGWDYAWVSTKLQTDSLTSTTVPKPVCMYVEQVYKEVSFSPFSFITIA